jgi:hypothetical protein
MSKRVLVSGTASVHFTQLIEVDDHIWDRMKPPNDDVLWAPGAESYIVGELDPEGFDYDAGDIDLSDVSLAVEREAE